MTSESPSMNSTLLLVVQTANGAAVLLTASSWQHCSRCYRHQAGRVQIVTNVRERLICTRNVTVIYYRRH